MNINMHDSTEVSAKNHDKNIKVFYIAFRMHYVCVVNFGSVNSCAGAACAEWLSFAASRISSGSL
jgi:hypothetical protein